MVRLFACLIACVFACLFVDVFACRCVFARLRVVGLFVSVFVAGRVTMCMHVCVFVLRLFVVVLCY